ncbi:DUF1801 domain-containing protein [Glycomyces sp. NPDC047010]|uniref:DUF1801 domain-containing protein n=1 Tax=Glycomyces sp. NPDC047010 TaxID=3155023 RepID=UPI0033DD3A07
MAEDDSMHRTDEDVAAFIAASARAETLARVDAVLREAMPGAPRTLWRGVFWGGTEQAIIGYGDLVQPRPRGRSADWFLIGLAEQQAHVSLYVNAVEDGAYLARTYADRLGRVRTGAASIAFKRIEDLDLTVLAEMAAHAARSLPGDAGGTGDGTGPDGLKG